MTDKFQKKIFLFSIFTTNVMSSELIPESYMAETKEGVETYGDGKINEKKEEINNSSETKYTGSKLNGGTEDSLGKKNEITAKEQVAGTVTGKELNNEEKIDNTFRETGGEKGGEKGGETNKKKGKDKNINDELNKIREKTKGKQNEQNGIPLQKFCSAI